MDSISFNSVDLPACKMRFHKRPITAILISVPVLFLCWIFIIKSPSNIHNNTETHQQLPPNFSPTKEGKKDKISLDELSAPESLAHIANKKDHRSSQPKEKRKYIIRDNTRNNDKKYSTQDPKVGGIIDSSVRLPIIFGGLTQGNTAPQYELEGMIKTYGVNGAPVQLSGEDQRLADEIMRKEAFNVFISDRISMHRNVPDTRDSACRKLSYSKSLPTASIIIIFTNEAFSTLLRTVWSVLDKSKDHPETVHEIILVDDFSDREHLKVELDRYIAKNFPPMVKLLRLSKREGLIRARLVGARHATGDILVFLDSHCECGDDWLRPLLYRIKEDKKVFAVPIIDVIDDKSLEYYHGNGNYFQIGGFTWSGHFNWIDVPDHEKKRRQLSTDPLRTPTMAGGLFAVNRHTFWELGSYDEEMDVWGGENLEMSFRVWQCGGSVETIPCSRVGHIFRNFHPYTFPGDKDTHGINTARTVEVWMDEYKELFYLHRPDLKAYSLGDLNKRLNFRKDLKCKSFTWYLENIYPQKYIPNDPTHVLAFGKFTNEGADQQCVDTLQQDDKDNFYLGVYPCHLNVITTSQFFSYSKKLELRHEDNCADVGQMSDDDNEGLQEGYYTPVKMGPCVEDDAGQKWKLSKKGRMMHLNTKKCLDVVPSGSEEGGLELNLVAVDCKRAPSQLWSFDQNFQ